VHRRKLLDLIGEYEANHVDESDLIERFVRFVSRESRCFERDCWQDGHVTGSAWVVDPGMTSVLLTHHKKLNIWVQLGGHSDGDPDTPAVACKEAREESGLEVDFVQPQIFDLDVHLIPERKQDPAHYHYDVRFAFVARGTDYTISEESKDLAWVPITDLLEYSSEESLLRMQRKWWR